MPLDKEAMEYADSLFSVEMDRLIKQRATRTQEITVDFSRRGMIRSGGYVNAMANAAVEDMEERARARMTTLISAYDRAGIPIDEEAEREILAKLLPICTHEHIVANLFRPPTVSQLGLPESAVASIRGRMERQCSGVFARLRQELVANRRGRALDARRFTSEDRPRHEADGAADTRTVFVVHGRDNRLRDSMFTFLRALDLRPLEWTEAIQLTGSAAPYVGEILQAAFSNARAVVVLLTPDDEARLRPDLQSEDDPDYERNFTRQARPNVLFEAGMALAYHPDRTILARIGTIRPFSDVAGRHAIQLDNSMERRQDLAMRLRNAGCSVNTDGTDWHTKGDFRPPDVG